MPELNKSATFNISIHPGVQCLHGDKVALLLTTWISEKTTGESV